jgi:ribosomal protein S15P/S13E
VPRIAYSVAEAAKMLGKRAEALRRHIERHAVVEGDDLVARLGLGVIASKRKGGGRWLITVPRSLME